jgi:polyisoprenyl-teichoic acid--peptidoglycan teichoic acid transferase
VTQVAPDSSRRARRVAGGGSHNHPETPRPPVSGAGAPSYYGAAAPETSLSAQVEPPRGRHATTQGQNFPRVICWTLLGGVVPGVGLIVAGRRAVGTAVLAVSAMLASALVTWLVIGDPKNLALSLASNPNLAVVLAAIVMVLVLAWAVVVVGTHASLRRYAHLQPSQRILSAVLVTSLIGLILVPTARAGNDALIWRDTVKGIFQDGEATGPLTAGQPDVKNAVDPWAGTERVNVLLIGSDAGADRTGIRPDTMIVASINTHNGNTVLFSLPRNLQHVPFPPGSGPAAEFPEGFYCYNATARTNTECLLNSTWTFGEEHWKQYYPQARSAFDAGLTATKQAAEQVTGLQIDQYAMLNLRGFMQFVDALGGITVNVDERLPIGGDAENHVATGWIEKGANQHLDGYHALWFARSRWSTSDYSRMARQRCVIGAVVSQANPAAMALAFPQIAAAAKSNILTDVPLRDLKAWILLSERVKQAKVKSLAFTDAVIDTQNPDIQKMREQVAKANEAADAAPSSASSGASPASSPTASRRPTAKASTPAATDQSRAQDVNQVC